MNIKNIKNLNIDNAEAFANQRYEGVHFEWDSSNIGSGELTIYKKNGANDWESECTSNDDKDFIHMIFDKWIDSIKITG